jgi:hypothetical protein
MNNMTTTRMLLSTAALAAVAALFAGGGNAKMLDEGGSAGGATPTSKAIENRAFGSGLIDDSALKVDRAVAAANEAYDTYRNKTASAAREALSTDQQPSVQFRGAHRGLRPGTRVSAPEPEGLTGDSAITRYPGTVTTPATSGGNAIDWTSFGAGAGMAALLAAAIAGVVLTTRRRGGIALP